MAIVTVLEAYYGGSVVLDFQTAEGREAGFRLALMTLEAMEQTAGDARFAVRLRVTSPDDPTRPAGDLTMEQALEVLAAYVTPAHRYFEHYVFVNESRPYSFGVLSEDGAGLCFGPSWAASKEWYDAFWAALWNVSQDLEKSIAGYELLTPGGDRRCANGHRLSPFRDHCTDCP